MNILKNLISIFHGVIIASLLLGVSGCGYKAAPYYIDEAPKGDENVKFIINKKTFKDDSNQSCSK